LINIGVGLQWGQSSLDSLVSKTEPKLNVELAWNREPSWVSSNETLPRSLSVHELDPVVLESLLEKSFQGDFDHSEEVILAESIVVIYLQEKDFVVVLGVESKVLVPNWVESVMDNRGLNRSHYLS